MVTMGYSIDIDKTSGEVLDWLIHHCYVKQGIETEPWTTAFAPSTNSEQFGVIVERELIGGIILGYNSAIYQYEATYGPESDTPEYISKNMAEVVLRCSSAHHLGGNNIEITDPAAVASLATAYAARDARTASESE